MDKYGLAEEILFMCKEFKILEEDVDDSLLGKNILDNLQDVIFVENILSILYKKRGVLKKLNRLINKLEEVKIELV